MGNRPLGIEVLFPFVQSVHLYFETLAREGILAKEQFWHVRKVLIWSGHPGWMQATCWVLSYSTAQNLHTHPSTKALASSESWDWILKYFNTGNTTIFGKHPWWLFVPWEKVCCFLSHSPTLLPWSGKLTSMDYIPHTVLTLDCLLGLTNEEY